MDATHYIASDDIPLSLVQFFLQTLTRHTDVGPVLVIGDVPALVMHITLSSENPRDIVLALRESSDIAACASQVQGATHHGLPDELLPSAVERTPEMMVKGVPSWSTTETDNYRQLLQDKAARRAQFAAKTGFKKRMREVKKEVEDDLIQQFEQSTNHCISWL